MKLRIIYGFEAFIIGTILGILLGASIGASHMVIMP